jgi:hypothetical protein
MAEPSSLIFRLDFAVYAKTTPQINLINNLDHIISLDNITIDETLFKSIFYQTDNFAINPNAALDELSLSKISFSNLTVSGVHFCLFDVILQNIEADLGVSSSMFSPCTNMALHKEINAVKSLVDLIQTGTIICSMKWSDIINALRCEENNGVADVILTLTVVFTNPTVGVNSTIIKFNYKTSITIITIV